MITGAGGMLGSALVAACVNYKLAVHAFTKAELDVTEKNEVKSVIRTAVPKAIFHLAALTDWDFCELNPLIAYDVNACSVIELVNSANKVGATLILLSSDGVFSGKANRKYSENDTPNPLSIYGKTKVMAEEYVRANADSYYIFRTGWLFGGFQKDKKFVAKIIEQALSGKEIKAVTDIFGSPTYTVDFANKMLSLVGSVPCGTYHLTNSGGASRHEIASVVLSQLGVNTIVQEAKSSDFAAPAPRPEFVELWNKALEDLGVAPLRSWNDALAEYVSEHRTSSKN